MGISISIGYYDINVPYTSEKGVKITATTLYSGTGSLNSFGVQVTDGTKSDEEISGTGNIKTISVYVKPTSVGTSCTVRFVSSYFPTSGSTRPSVYSRTCGVSLYYPVSRYYGNELIDTKAEFNSTISSDTLSSISVAGDFLGWYTTSALSTRVNVGDAISDAISIYASVDEYNNKISFNGNNFVDEDLISGNVLLNNSMVSETLEADSMEFTIIGGSTEIWSLTDAISSTTDIICGGIGELSSYIYGTPVEYYHRGKLVGRFYITNVVRTGLSQYTFTALSAVGLLIRIKYYGNVYYGVGNNVHSVIKSIFETAFGQSSQTTSGSCYVVSFANGFSYKIEQNLESVTVQGWLPICTCRDALQHTLFSCGASILKDAGVLHIGYNEPTDAKVIADGNVYLGGSVDFIAPATLMSLTEHSYIVDTTVDEEILYDTLDLDSTPTSDQLVELSNPIIVHNYDNSHAYGTVRAVDADNQDITSTVIGTLHTNYLIINAGYKCKVLGKAWTHITQTLTKDLSSLNPNSEPTEKSVENATLISSLNSTNALARVSDYYSLAKEVSYGLVMDGEHTGDMIRYKNPYYEIENGIIKSMDINLSTILKAQMVVASNWYPSHLGNDYDSYYVLDKTALGSLSATWNVPENLQGKNVMVVMFNSGSGGAGGNQGANGGNSGGSGRHTISTGDITLYDYTAGSAGKGGAGGTGGNGGAGSNKYNSIKLTLGSSYVVALGEGGQGGASGTEATETHNTTTFGTYNSDSNTLDGVYINFIDRNIYGGVGNTGESGANGGNGGTGNNWETEGYTSGVNGGNYEPNTGGTATSGNSDYWGDTHGYSYFNVGGGGGGGACKGANGSNALSADSSSHIDYHDRLLIAYTTMKGGDGGNGASVPQGTVPSQSALGKGGTGGYGGGGGGGGGASCMTSNRFVENREAYGGTGGTGGVGGKGSDGFCIIYYKA